MDDYILPNDFSLNCSEINRQAKIIDSYFKNGLFVNAVRLMREFVVSRCMLKMGKEDWLIREKRLKIEHKLSYYANQNKTEPSELGKIWDELGQARNHIAHCGMTCSKIKLDKTINEVKKKWEQIREEMDNEEFWDLTIERGGGKILVTPLGLSPGLLFTALKKVEPDICIIFTSKQVKNSIDSIMTKANYTGKKHVIVIDNVYSGSDEIYQKVQQLNNDFSSDFRKADEIIINLTGGTTTLQYAVEILSQSIEFINSNIRKVAMIDRRDILVQGKKPFVEGEVVELKSFAILKERFGGDDEDE